MSDQDKKSDDADLDFDWNDALADWERDLDKRDDKAPGGLQPAAPAAAKPPPKPEVKEPGRPLYRPPNPDEFKRPVPRPPPRVAATPPAKPTPPPIEEEIHLRFDEDDDDIQTQIAAVPENLIASLSPLSKPGDPATKPSGTATARPPPGHGVDLDLDDMLQGLDGETRPREPVAFGPVSSSAPAAGASPTVRPPPALAESSDSRASTSGGVSPRPPVVPSPSALIGSKAMSKAPVVPSPRALPPRPMTPPPSRAGFPAVTPKVPGPTAKPAMPSTVTSATVTSATGGPASSGTRPLRDLGHEVLPEETTTRLDEASLSNALRAPATPAEGAADDTRLELDSAPAPRARAPIVSAGSSTGRPQGAASDALAIAPSGPVSGAPTPALGSPRPDIMLASVRSNAPAPHPAGDVIGLAESAPPFDFGDPGISGSAAVGESDVEDAFFEQPDRSIRRSSIPAPRSVEEDLAALEAELDAAVASAPPSLASASAPAARPPNVPAPAPKPAPPALELDEFGIGLDGWDDALPTMIKHESAISGRPRARDPSVPPPLPGRSSSPDIRISDAPELAIGSSAPPDVDDDLEAIEIEPGAVLDQEFDATFGDDLDDLAPPTSHPPPPRAAPVAAPRAPRVDRGAAAARRTVHSRKPRVEVHPLVGRSSEALAARRDLLLRLATDAHGSVKARLCLAAAEIEHQLGRPDAARAHVTAAREADPRDAVALRAARRDAISRRAFDEVASLLESEARLPLSPAERSAALLALAEIHLRHRNDPSAAEKVALEALALSPRSVVAALIMAEARAAAGRQNASSDALRRAAEAWGDPRAKAALLVTSARESEKSSDVERALELYRAATEADPQAIDAVLGIARCERGSGAGEALGAIANAMPEGMLRDVFARRAARTLLGSAKTDEERTHAAGRAYEWLADARSLAALRTRAIAASSLPDRDAEISALESWAGASGGTDRALALVRLAEAHAETGEIDAAEETLRTASLADAQLGTIRIVRELVARRTGDRSRLVQAVESSGALAAAAKLALDGANEARERSLVQAARREDEAPLSAEVLWLDLAAGANDEAEVNAGLRREVDRTAPDQRSGALLALADRSLYAGDTETAERVLREARDLAPGSAVLLRPLGRLAMARSGRDAASLWLDEATASSEGRAAFAATAAGTLLEAAEGDAISAYRRALDAKPGYGPALWSLEPVARSAGDLSALIEVHEQEASATPSSIDAAAHLVRAALLRAEDDIAAASAFLRRAHQKAQGDAIAIELALRLADGFTAEERAKLLLLVAQGAPAPLSRAMELGAAASLEDANQHAQAAEIYRSLVTKHELDSMIALGLDRAELAAGELARVAERRFSRVRDAENDEARLLALERLAELDMEQRGDPASAVLSLHSILEVAPGHIPSLRTLERYYLEQKRNEEVIAIEERFAQHLSDPGDVLVHLRLGSRLLLAPAEAFGEAADSFLLAQASRARLDGWLARRVAAAARAAGATDVAAKMESEVASRMASPLERASIAMRAAEVRAVADGGSKAAAELLAPYVQASEEHPTASDLLAKLADAAADPRGAAEALTLLARASKVPARAASAWYRAGVLWQDTIGDEEQALVALTESSKLDIAHLDVFERLRNLLELREDHAALSELVDRRLRGSGDSALLVELHSIQAKLKEKLGDRDAAKESLKAVLALSPEKLDALRRLGELSLEDEDYRTAAEALIRIARVRKDRDELRWVFFTLGDIYDRHIPDPKRAEAAFRRVLKLVPDDLVAMERLAALFRRESQFQAAAEQLGELSRLEPDPDRSRAHRLTLADVHEKLGDHRRAEQVLESARKAAPTEITTLKAIAEFYQRQRAQSALAMHLNRAVGDFRHAIQTDLGDTGAWLGLVEVLRWRGKNDPARAVAAMAAALGVRDAEIARLLDAQGSAPGAGAAAADGSLDELLAPASLPIAARAVMRLAGPALEKTLVFDPKIYKAEKMGQRDAGFRPAALEVARWFGVTDLELWVSASSPRICLPIASGPPIALLIGRDVLQLDERERIFALARALKIAREGLTLALRASPEELATVLGALVFHFDPNHRAPGIQPNVLADWSKRIAKQLPRRAGDELGPAVFEMAGSPDYDPSKIAAAASELGDRAALIAGGSGIAALSALLKMSGEPGLAESAPSRIAQLRRFPELASLALFAISDLHFEARHRAGADRA